MYLKFVFRFFLFQHFVISIAAIALCWQTYIILSSYVYNYNLAGFLFFATLLSYNTHFWLASKKNTSSLQLNWFRQHQIFTLVFNIVAFIATVYFWYQVKEITGIILIAILLNAAYTAPLLFKSPLKLPLLFTFIKSYFIGFTWAFVTTVLPLKLLGPEQGLPVSLLFLQRFMLVSIATIIFDCRDRLLDREWGVHTPANFLNEKQLRLFFIINLLIYAVIVLCMSVSSGNYLHLLQLIPALVLWQLFQQSARTNSDVFYLVWVDGVLILSPLLSLALLF